MAYSNYLVKVGNYTIPENFIKYDSFSALYSTTDLDSYRDANGVLHRNALSHKVAKVEFETPYMYSSDVDTLMSNIRSNFTSLVEKKANVSVYIKEINDYVTGYMYMPDVTFQIAQNSPNGFIYAPIRIAFIGY